jgi:hypothetical protein
LSIFLQYCKVLQFNSLDLIQIIYLSRIAKLFQDEEPKLRGKSMFKLTDEQQTGFLQNRIQKKIRRQQDRKLELDERSNALTQQMSQTTDEMRELTQRLNAHEEEEKVDSRRQEIEGQNRSNCLRNSL